MKRGFFELCGCLAMVALLAVGCASDGGSNPPPAGLNPGLGGVWQPGGAPADGGGSRPELPIGLPASPTEGDPALSRDVPLRVGDMVRVNFSGINPAPDPHQEQIRDDGNITLLYNVAVKAAGRTPGELQEAIRDAYVPKIFRHLTVTVTTDARVYFVGGEVKIPSRLTYAGPITVLRAIDTAGGLTEYSNRKKVELQRFNGELIQFNYDKAQKNPELDLPVYPGDRVFVPSRFY